ncbi:hypothetical protein CMV30_04650 [Nibricoccus aquaticus]|uniref:Uncharacterized protein n=1 Tax=Nibricoccus aquaticus TaxID=2576891 RepID=A0A290Q800_9BACT|nr:hypothetical protein CMV30_04650 [Nibricoccus aquaticus]
MPSSAACTPGSVCNARFTSAADPGIINISTGVSVALLDPPPAVNCPAAAPLTTNFSKVTSAASSFFSGAACATAADNKTSHRACFLKLIPPAYVFFAFSGCVTRPPPKSHRP